MALTTTKASKTLTPISKPALVQTSQVGIALAYSTIVCATAGGTFASGETSGSKTLLCATVKGVRLVLLFVITRRTGKPRVATLWQDLRMAE